MGIGCLFARSTGGLFENFENGDRASLALLLWQKLSARGEFSGGNGETGDDEVAIAGCNGAQKKYGEQRENATKVKKGTRLGTGVAGVTGAKRTQ